MGGRVSIIVVRKSRYAIRACSGSFGYRGGVNAIKFATTSILDSTVIEATRAGIEEDRIGSESKGRCEENCVKDASGKRLGRRGIVRT